MCRRHCSSFSLPSSRNTCLTAIAVEKHFHFVSYEYTNAVKLHLTAKVGNNLMVSTILSVDNAKHGIRQCLGYRSSYN